MKSSTEIVISDKIRMPIDAVTQTLACIGRKGAREMLDVLVHANSRTLSRSQIGEKIGMEPSGGTFAAYLSDLRQAGLICVDSLGVRANTETLLIGGRQ